MDVFNGRGLSAPSILIIHDEYCSDDDDYNTLYPQQFFADENRKYVDASSQFEGQIYG